MTMRMITAFSAGKKKGSHWTSEHFKMLKENLTTQNSYAAKICLKSKAKIKISADEQRRKKLLVNTF